MNTNADFRIDPFSDDGKDFAKVLESIEFNRDIFAKFNNLTYSYKNAYAPLSFLLKPIAKMCEMETRKLDKQIKILQEICAIYESVGNVIQKTITSREERALARTTLSILVIKLTEHEDQMRQWHKLLKSKVLYMHQSCQNAKRLINGLY